jgi:hypothetical protein
MGDASLSFLKKRFLRSRPLDMTKTELKAEVNAQLRRFDSRFGMERKGE